jgi:hypothetical protein
MKTPDCVVRRLFLRYLACQFVVVQRNEFGVPEVIFAGPFQELDLDD